MTTLQPSLSEQWFDDRRRAPSWLIVDLDAPLREGAFVSVYILPAIDKRDYLGAARESRFQHGYENPFRLFAGTLDADAASQFDAALSVIAALQGVSRREGLAFLAYTFLLAVDLYLMGAGQLALQDQRAQARIHFRDPDAAVREMNRPLYSVHQVLQVWSHLGSKIASCHLYRSPDGGPGRPEFFSIPPAWRTPDQLADADADGRSTVPVLVRPDCADTTRKFVEFSELLTAAGAHLTMPFTIRGSPQSHVTPDIPKGPLLTAADEEECKAHGFNSRHRIHVTGQIESRKSNLIAIGDAQVTLPDAEFKTFLRLVLALFESPDGYLSPETLRFASEEDDEGLFFPDGLDRAASRLRARIGPALGGLKPQKFIEVSRRRIRISTHRRYVLFDKESLIRHPDAIIVSVASRLPEDREPRPSAQAPG